MSRMTYSLCFSYLLFTASPVAAADASEAQARAAVQDFLSAREGRNLDDLMKVVDVPWYHDRKSVITERNELQNEFHRLLSRKNQAKVRYELRRLSSYQELRDRFTEDERRMIDQVITPKDMIAFITVSAVGADRLDVLLLLVRLRDGHGKVVGIQN